MISKSLGGIRHHVWSEDCALDKSDPDVFAAAWKAFLENGDETALPLLDGGTPAVFDLVPLTRRQFLRVYSGGGSPLEQMTEAVAYGLRAVRGFEVNSRPADVRSVDSDAGKRLDAATLDALFDPMLFAELGARVLEISRLDPTRGRG